MEDTNGRDWREQLLRIYRPERQAPAPVVYILGRDEPLGALQLRQLARAAHREGAPELHLLAWDFPSWPGCEVERAMDTLPLPVRLVRIPREALDSQGARRVSFVEAALLDAELVRHPDGALDVRLVRFRPGLPLDAAVPEEMRARAASSGFDFLTSWSVDFTFCPEHPPFHHHWSSFRLPRDRKLKLASEARWNPQAKGTQVVGVKVVDVFGYETVTCAKGGEQ